MTDADVTAALADRLTHAIVDAIQREYPNAPQHVMRHADDRPSPREIHPAFYGSFDWHSAVEMHWALVRLLRRFPGEHHDAEVRAVLDEHLSAANLQAEADYFADNPSYERPYGWGWALALADVLADWAGAGDSDAVRWSAAMAPLATVIESGLLDWLPKPAYPDRTGMHSNSAFALSRALPWARRGSGELLAAIEQAAHRWFGHDSQYCSAFEPSGSDFLSPTLTEMVLMRELLDDARFATWIDDFNAGLVRAIGEPARVTDEHDGQGAHLHGLNLYRLYAFGMLTSRDPEHQQVYADAYAAHVPAANAALAATGWMSEHWLAAYAVLAFC